VQHADVKYLVRGGNTYLSENGESVCVKEAPQDMTTNEGQLTWAAKQARGMANSVEANELRRRREPPIIDWDEAIANLLDTLDDISPL
jgi:hypothetical protein